MKQRIALRYWLQGRSMYMALDAMEFAAGYHKGVRKDGVTPEFSHQIAIASHVRTLEPHLLYPQETIAAAFLHDVREDYDVSDAKVRALFGPVVADAVDALTKVFAGRKRDLAVVAAAIAANPVASIVKAADRVHNQRTMVGVFSPEKIGAYCTETREFILPTVKKARRAFPSQEGAYENLSLVLHTQLELLEHLI